MKRNKWKQRLIFTVELACAVAFGVALYPPQRRLLQRASKVADVQGWWLPEPGAEDYRWVSDTVLLTAKSGWRLESPFLYDLRSHQKSSLSGLSQRLKGDNNIRVSSGWQLSPDGRWLLWKSDALHADARGLQADVRAARLDGSGFQIAPLLPPDDTVVQVGWQDGQGHWIAEGFNIAFGLPTHMFGGDVNLPGQRRALPHSEGDRSFDTNVLQVDELRRFVVVTLADGDALAHPNSKTITLYPPNAGMIMEVVKSTRGDRLAWVLRSRPSPPLEEWFHRVFPRSGPPHPSVAIWVSRLDGSQMQEVGHLMMAGGAYEAVPIYELRWLPSDSHLSFLYKDGLWTVPVD